MADRGWTIGLGCLNLAASALVASLSLSASARQDDLVAELARQKGQLRTLIVGTASLGARIDRLGSLVPKLPAHARSIARP